MNNHLEQKIITPRIAELVSSNGSDLETKKTSSGQVRAEIQSNNIAGTRLTIPFSFSILAAPFLHIFCQHLCIFPAKTHIHKALILLILVFA